MHIILSTATYGDLSVSVAALIVAAGRGARAAGPKRLIPKQYLPIGGVPMLTRSIAAFAGHPKVDDVLVVIHPDDCRLYEAASQSLSSRVAASRSQAARGARTRSALGSRRLPKARPPRVLIHDAARPFVDAGLIGRVIASLDSHAGALPCLPVTDTLEVGQHAGRVTGTARARSALARADAARLPLRCDPCRASRRGERAAREFTDDAGIAEWFGLDVALVEGAEDNRKLTTAEDHRKRRRAARGFGRATGTARSAWHTAMTCMPSVPGDAVILCGVRIPHPEEARSATAMPMSACMR